MTRRGPAVVAGEHGGPEVLGLRDDVAVPGATAKEAHRALASRETLGKVLLAAAM